MPGRPAPNRDMDLQKLKVVVAGDAGCGKTAFIQRYANDVDEAPLSRLSVDFATRTVDLDAAGREQVKAQLWDTCGQERFGRSMPRGYYRNAGVVLLFFDMTNRPTFDALPAWIADIRAGGDGGGAAVPGPPPGEPPVVVLIGSKSDLAADRVVPADEARAFAEAEMMLYAESTSKARATTEAVMAAAVGAAFRGASARRGAVRLPAALTLSPNGDRRSSLLGGCGRC
jgi:GTPase SAR1 family protein